MDSLYTVLQAEDGDDPMVEGQSTVTSGSGASFTFTDAYALSGNVLNRIGRIGNAGLSPDSDDQEWFFGLEPLEEGTSTALVDNGARSSVDGSILHDDVSDTRICIGNDTLDTPMGAFETCRVVTRLLDGTAESTSWYAAGRGIEVKKFNSLYRAETELGLLESTTQREFASINGVSIAP